MRFGEQDMPFKFLRWELPFVCFLAWIVFVSIPMTLGEIGISWDALNHHIYLGWTAEHSRFDRDLLAASYQSYQFPYLYWPVYKLAASGFTGMWAGVVLASISCVSVPPVWLIARICIPGNGWFDALMRLLAVVLAFMSILVLSLFDSTSNDLFAAIPFLWALALAFQLLSADCPKKERVFKRVIMSGLLAGISVAFKLSNGPLVLLLPGLWLLSGASLKTRLVNTFSGGVATLFGFLLVYGYWGWQLWHNFGNPVYPFFDTFFASLRPLIGWGQ